MRGLTLALALASSSTSAAELELIVSTVSWHSAPAYTTRAKSIDDSPAPSSPPATRHEQKNTLTPGLGLSLELAPGTRAIAGAYRNSIDQVSRYAVLQRELVPGLAVAAGYVDGYDRTPLGAALVLELGRARILATPSALSLWFAFGLPERAAQ